MNHIVSVAMDIDDMYTEEQQEVESEEDVSPQIRDIQSIFSYNLFS